MPLVSAVLQERVEDGSLEVDGEAEPVHQHPGDACTKPERGRVKGEIRLAALPCEVAATAGDEG